MAGGSFRAFGVLCIAAALAGCQSMSEMFKSDSLPSPRESAYGANLIAKNGSAAGGTVRLVPRDDGLGISVYATGLPPGRFRVVIHANGNCSSPNAFSAGAPWAPQRGAPVVLTITAQSDGGAFLSTRIRGYKLEGADGLMGKAVVLHEASGSLDAQPGVPNGRIACGVIGPMRVLTF